MITIISARLLLFNARNFGSCIMYQKNELCMAFKVHLKDTVQVHYCGSKVGNGIKRIQHVQ